VDWKPIVLRLLWQDIYLLAVGEIDYFQLLEAGLLEVRNVQVITIVKAFLCRTNLTLNPSGVYSL
jgi:hypothetical protein